MEIINLRVASFNISGGYYIGDEDNEFLDRESVSTVDNRLQKQIIDIINDENIDVICLCKRDPLGQGNITAPFTAGRIYKVFSFNTTGIS